MIFTSYYEVIDRSGIRFESLSRDEAIEFATKLHQKEGVICDISEITRPDSHQKRTFGSAKKA